MSLLKYHQGQGIAEEMLKYLISIQNAQSILFGNCKD